MKTYPQNQFYTNGKGVGQLSNLN